MEQEQYVFKAAEDAVVTGYCRSGQLGYKRCKMAPICAFIVRFAANILTVIQYALTIAVVVLPIWFAYALSEWRFLLFYVAIAIAWAAYDAL